MSTAAHDGEAPLPLIIPLRSMTKQEPNTVCPFCISGSRSAECHAEIAKESHEVHIIVHSQHVASPGGRNAHHGHWRAVPYGVGGGSPAILKK